MAIFNSYVKLPEGKNRCLKLQASIGFEWQLSAVIAAIKSVCRQGTSVARQHWADMGL